MKKLKQLMAMMLTAVMILSMAVTGFAAVGNGSLTVNLAGENNATENQTVKLYKLYTLDSYSGDNYSYSVNDKYLATLQSVLGMSGSDGDAILEKLGTYTDNQPELQKFANDFTKAAKSLDPDKTGTITSGAKSTTISDVPAGYYLVVLGDTKVVQSNLIPVKDGNTIITLKAEAPSIEKTADKTDVEIGEIVTYTITTTIPETLSDTFVYKITDTLSDGLDFVNFNDNSAASGNLVIETQLDGSATTGITASVSGRTMTIDLSQYVKDHQTSDIGKTLTIKYKAKVNANAVVTEKNSASLEYGNNPDETITNKPEEVKTPTFPIHINKTDNDGNILAGAKFRLYTSEESANAKGDDAIKVTGDNGIYVYDEGSSNMDMVTVNPAIGAHIDEITGQYNLRVNGLKAGTYWLSEIAAPDGYNVIKKPIKIIIENTSKDGIVSWTISKDGADETDKIIDIVNTTGAELPETGGMGTVLFTVIGAALIIMAGIRLARRNSEQE